MWGAEERKPATSRQNRHLVHLLKLLELMRNHYDYTPFISKPTIVFADEPTGNLDSTTSGEILELMRSSVDAYGQTTVMVTHDARAAAIADRILFLDDGLIVKELGRSDAHEVISVLEDIAAK